MEYQKHKRDNYNIHMIKTDRFKAVNVEVYFAKKIEKDDALYLSLLKRLLFVTTKKYNTGYKIARKSEDLYGLLCGMGSYRQGEIEHISMGIEFINPKYTEESMYKESISFFKDCILNPNIKDNKFNESEFELAKLNIINNIKSSIEDPTKVSSKGFRKEMYKSTIYEDRSITVKDVEKATHSKLIKYYNSVINDSTINIMVLGDIKEDDILPHIDNAFKNIKSKKVNAKIYDEYKDYHKIVEKIESSKFNQSQLVMGFKIKGITEYERNYVLEIYNHIFGSAETSLLFYKVREEKGLCYSIYSSFIKYLPTIYVVCGINKDSYKEAVSTIKSALKLMSNKDIISKHIDTIKNRIETFINDTYDDVSYIIDHYYYKEFENIDDIETIREKLTNVSVEDIINLNKKVSLSVIYFLKGEGE